MTVRFCKTCEGWHDLNEPWPDACSSHFRATIGGGSIQIIKDVEPYKAVATDVDGKRPVIGGRRQHREFLQRNNYREVGTDTTIRKREPQYDLATPRDVKRAIEQLRDR